jgi:hypothetical protein
MDWNLMVVELASGVALGCWILIVGGRSDSSVGIGEENGIRVGSGMALFEEHDEKRMEKYNVISANRVFRRWITFPPMIDS